MSQKSKMNILDVRQRLLSQKPRINSDKAFERILSTADMAWLKTNSPETCADVLLSLYEKIPEKDKFNTGYYLLDGNFA